MKDQDQFLLEIVGYDSGLPGTRTLRYATGDGYITEPTDAPANTYYDARVRQPLLMSRTMFAPRTTRGRSTFGLGDLELLNGDGALDDLINYGFDGRLLTVRRGPADRQWRRNSRAGTWTSSGVTLAATAARINDTDLATNAWHTDTAVSGAYVQANYGVPVEFSRLRIYAVSGAYAGNYKVRGSPDGATWTDLITGFVPNVAGWNQILFAPATHQYWRAELTNTPGAGSWLNEAEFDRWFVTDLVATMQNIEAETDKLTIKLRDRQAEMNNPLQPTKYAGTNALPAGLEGVDDIKGKPKPVCLGRVLNVPAVLVNTSKLIYQVNDGAIASLDAVYDRGVALRATLGPLFVAAGDNGTVNVSSSPDGATWTNRSTTAGNTSTFNGVAWGAGMWVMVGNTPTNTYLFSTDGITWTQRTIVTNAPSAVTLRCVRYLNGRFYVGGDTGFLASSADCVTWTLASGSPSVFGSKSIQDITWNGTTFVATTDANSGASIWSSPDGLNWTATTLAGKWYSLSWGAGLFVLGGHDGANVPKIYTSPDGLTWTARTVPASHTTGRYATGIFANNLFVLAGFATAANTPQIATSSDGITWTARTSAAAFVATCRGITYGVGIYIVAGRNSTGTRFIQTSSDGTTWTNQTVSSAGADGFFAIGFGEGSSAATYANAMDLEDDTKAPVAGAFKGYLAGGYFRLGAAPAGLITADVTEGATTADRYAAQLFKRLLLRAGKSASDYSASDLTTLDAAAPFECGFWTDQEIAYSGVFDQVAESVDGSWFIDRANLYRFKQLLAPTGSPVVALTANDLKIPPVFVTPNDLGQGIPIYQTVVRYARNYIVQDSDVAASVSAARRGVLAKEWREAKATDAAVQTAHLLAYQLSYDSLLYAAVDAQSEATRRQALRGTQRRMAELVLALTDINAAIDIADVISLQYPRFGLSAGVLMRVLDIAVDGEARELTWTVWY